MSPGSLAFAGEFFTTEPPDNPQYTQQTLYLILSKYTVQSSLLSTDAKVLMLQSVNTDY